MITNTLYPEHDRWTTPTHGTSTRVVFYTHFAYGTPQTTHFYTHFAYGTPQTPRSVRRWFLDNTPPGQAEIARLRRRLKALGEDVREFGRAVDRHLAQVREWTRRALAELRLLQRRPVLRLELPRQSPLVAGRVCASSARWRVRVP